MLIGAVVIFFFCLFFFSKNPLDELRKKRELRKAKSLVEKIVANANKKDSKGGLLKTKQPTPSGLRYGMDTSSDVQPAEPGEIGKTVGGGRATGGVRTPSATTLRNPYLQGKTKKTIPVGDPSAPADPGSTSAPTENYYPPPALKHSGPGEKPNSMLEQLFDPGFGMRMSMSVPAEGYENLPPIQQKMEAKSIYVGFEGIKAYTMDESGKPQPLPDGFYTLPNTNHKVLIRAGEKVIPN
jgi:hypothetical protein